MIKKTKVSTKTKAGKTAAPACRTNKDMCKGGAIYGLGFVGAAFYYITTASGFWNGVWGVIKAVFWPAFLVYKSFLYLGL